MPAGQPSVPGGLDRRFITADRVFRNAGADTSVNYQASAFNPANGDILIAGNNDYVGLMPDGIFGEPVQGAALPLSSNTFISAALNKAAGGWLLMDTISAVFRGAADLSSWTTITPPAGTSRTTILEYNGRILTSTFHLTLPTRDIEFSDDDGATWDSNPGIFTGLATNLNGIFTNPDQTRLLAIASGGLQAAFTTVDDAASGWTLFAVNNPGGVPMNHAALSDDGDKCVIVTSIGNITTTADFVTFNAIPPSENPFQSTSVSGEPIASVVYVAGLEGFILMQSNAFAVGFIPEADMTQVFVSSHLGAGVFIPLRQGVSDGVQALWAGSSNEAMCTLRNVGQPGET